MNKSRNYIILLLSFVLLPLFTSCFSDSDADKSPNDLNEEELAAYFKKMNGSYRGKLYYTFIGGNEIGVPTMKRDSLEDVEWTLTETGEFKLDRLPVSMFAQALSAGSAFAYLADEIAKCEDVTIEGKYLPYKTADNWSYPFNVYPNEGGIVLNVEEGVKNHKVVLSYSNSIKFLGLYYFMLGECRIHANQMMITLPIGDATIDGMSAGVEQSMFSFAGVRKAPKNN